MQPRPVVISMFLRRTFEPVIALRYQEWLEMILVSFIRMEIVFLDAQE